MLICMTLLLSRISFFFNVTATTEIYTLSLHDALPISTICNWPVKSVSDGGPFQMTSTSVSRAAETAPAWTDCQNRCAWPLRSEEHSLNSSHVEISYAVFCLKKKTDYMQKHIALSHLRY